MTDLQERLTFLKRVITKEIKHLEYSVDQVKQIHFTPENTSRLETDQELAETVEAFVSRFSRLQDNTADKLLPNWLRALGETTGAAIDNLDKAEKFRLLNSADRWLEIRQLRNFMVHEYIESPEVLGNALESAKSYCPILIAFANSMINDLETRQII